MIFKKGDFINDCEILEIHNNPNKNKITLDVRCVKCGRTRNVCYKNIVDGPALSTKHGKSCAEQVKGYSTHFYLAWANMRTRTKPNYAKAKTYYERGINSDEFKCFVDFYDTFYESYLSHVMLHGEKDTTLERVDVNGSYTKENCIWTTKQKQAGNKTTTIEVVGVDPSGNCYNIRNLKRFCENHGLNYQNIYQGVHKYIDSNKKDWKYFNRKSGWYFMMCNDYSVRK